MKSRIKLLLLLAIFPQYQLFSSENIIAETTVVEKQEGNFKLLIKSHEDFPKLISKETIQSSDLVINFSSLNPPQNWEFKCVEIDAPNDIDYSQSNQGNLKIII